MTALDFAFDLAVRACLVAADLLALAVFCVVVAMVMHPDWAARVVAAVMP